MSYPGFNFLTGAFSPAQQAELQQFAAYLQGYLSTQHEADGSHGAITAKSLDLIANTETGGTGNLTADGTGSFDGNVTADADGSPVITGTIAASGSVRAVVGIDMRKSTARMRVGAYDPGSNDRALLFQDFANGSLYTLQLLWSNAVGRYYFAPDTFKAVDLGRDANGERFDIAYMKTGVKFSGTTSSDANTLDYYEESTWTPGLTFGGGSTGLTYSTRTGTYTRIGNVVTIELRIALSAKGSSTGTAAITGVPFSGAANPAALLNCATGMSGLTSQPYAVISGTSLLPAQGTATGQTQLDDTHFTNSSDIRLGLTYRI